MDAYDFFQKQIRDCDEHLKKYMAAVPTREAVEVKAEVAVTIGTGVEQPKPKPEQEKDKKVLRQPRKNQPQFDFEEELKRICGVNLRAIDGVDVMTIFTVISEVGTDMTPWRTEDHFVSWLKLCPQRQISGGKLIRHEHGLFKNRAAEALRMAASTLTRSQSYLGARFRSLRSRLGPGKAIKAMAAHLDRIIYRMMKYGQEWVDRGVRQYEAKLQTRERYSLERRAAAMGFRVVPIA